MDLMIEENEGMILCLGEDYCIHTCSPDSDTTECGKKIRRKKITDHDLVKYYNCYECTY
jgi:hypothetical protein